MGGDRDFGDAGSALFVPAVFIHLNYTGRGGVDKQCAERNHDVLGMLLSWTPVGHVSVEGVQGRYFLPFLLILLTACRNNGIYLRTKMDRTIITAALSGQLLTIVYVIKQVMAV